MNLSIEFGYDHGFKFRFGKSHVTDPRAGYDKDGKRINFKTGFRFDLKTGKTGGVCPKFYKKEFYSRNFWIREPKTNPFNSGNYWFKWPVIPCIFPYFFFSIFKMGGYFGFKGFRVDADSSALLDYDTMLVMRNIGRSQLIEFDPDFYWDAHRNDIQTWHPELNKDTCWKYYCMYGIRIGHRVNDSQNIPHNVLTQEQLDFLNNHPVRVFKKNNQGKYIFTWGEKLQGEILYIPTASLRINIIDT